MAYSISSDKTELNFDSFGNVGTNIKITLDSSVDNNSYYIDDSSYYTWFNIKRDRNQLTIFVKPNFSTEERIGYITCIHNLDFNVRTYITVSQDGMIYDVTAIESEIILPSNEEKNREIDVNVTGGSENFYIKSIKQYNTTKQIVNGVDEELPYDKGLQLTKIWNEDKKKWQLSIKSYGRTFVDDTNYYIITLAHKDNRKVTSEIKVKYTEGSYNINVSPSSLNFNYKGETDTNTVEISFPNTVDYGYIVKYEEEEWFTVTENPTSLTVNVTVNGSSKTRETSITIMSINDENESEPLNINQESFTDYRIDIYDTSYVFEKDFNEIQQVAFEIYGDGEFTKSNIRGYEDWCNLGELTTSVEGVLFKQYVANFNIKQNTNNDERNCKIVITHPNDGSIKKEITFLQYGTNADNKPIREGTPPSGNSNTVTVITTPEDSGINAYCTAKWGYVEINNKTITVTADSNYWNVDRYCKLIITNEEDPTMSIIYKVKQDENGIVTIDTL